MGHGRDHHRCRSRGPGMRPGRFPSRSGQPHRTVGTVVGVDDAGHAVAAARALGWYTTDRPPARSWATPVGCCGPAATCSASNPTSPDCASPGGSTWIRNFIICSCHLAPARRAGAPRRPARSGAASPCDPVRSRVRPGSKDPSPPPRPRSAPHRPPATPRSAGPFHRRCSQCSRCSHPGRRRLRRTRPTAASPRA